MKPPHYCVFDTPLGPCGLAWRDGGPEGAPPAVVSFQLPDATVQATEARIARESGARPSSAPPAIAAIIERIRRHLGGEAEDFRDIEVGLDHVGPFARQVYAAARAIPAGRTATYGEIAEAVARPGAARAVGQALGKNPIPLIIPCHRVLAAGGKPGGFSAPGGLATKSRMLAVEGVSWGLPPALKSVQDLRRAAARLKAQDPQLAECLSRTVLFKPNTGHSPYTALFSAVVHQQLTPKAAATILNRVKALYPTAAIPEPGELLSTPDEALREAGLSKAKTAALKDLATKTLDGTVPDTRTIVALSDEEVVRRLTSIRGVGKWTVEMLLIFNLGRMDVFPVDDYALRKGIAKVYGMPEVPTPKQLSALGDAWRPYRTVASLYLWNVVNAEIF
ncbi:methylated-DNA-protein-cysteine methyltransferase [Methylocaldum marinum]|uniref:Methylated-DNA-protein-cysteine methyltransferase n=1 Tax=Methylocaldum marinum TaxID=1432792 RepID=A0A250KXE6_9GAMM|nr:methylated-DNA--[protein]-cysteine S-methyltransferase [Methylocaldum marinum]BBA36297.1 methylated-DNA-protein-cysteine methyltransferase [Methylocaldum marinum]